jgi:hypothetical protein
VINAKERRCRAQNKRGERCAAHVINAAGYCVAHDPEKPMDMRALGRKSGEARRRPNPERVPASLRDELQKLDPAIVRGAIEQALAGDNESARVSAVKLLADVDAFRKDGECPRCAEAAAEAEANSEKNREAIIKLVLDSVAQIIEADPHPVASMAAAYLDERQKQRIAKLRTLRLDQIRSASVDEMTREALAGA